MSPRSSKRSSERLRAALFQKKLEQRIEEFVQDITTLARESLMETLQLTMDNGFSLSPGGHTKRTAQEIEDAMNALLLFLIQNPGASAADIAAALRWEQKSIQLPLNRLITQKSVKTSGQKRSMRYSLSARGKTRATKLV